MFEKEQKDRIIQEYVPGKQLNLAHIIAKPNPTLYKKLGLNEEYKEAIGILTITPSEAAIIASDVCLKSANVQLGFIDRFSGAVIIVGEISSVQSAVNNAMTMLKNVLKFDVCEITKS